MAIASTQSVKSSREPESATRWRIHGKRRLPTMSMPATNTATPSSVLESEMTMSLGSTGPSPCVTCATSGRHTMMKTVTRSCTTSQPMATWPLGVTESLRSSRAFITTTVDAHESVMPKTIALGSTQSQARSATTVPAAPDAAICSIAPVTATPLTFTRSATEKCRPTPNIRSITPISANCSVTTRSTLGRSGKRPTDTPAMM